jgi:tetratricopeptide (TPR) repeat protein
MVRLYVSLEEWHTALDMANRSMLAFKELGRTDDLPDIYMDLAQAWVGLGNLPMAQKWAREAREMIEAGGEDTLISNDFGRCLRLQGELALLDEDYAQAETDFKDCIPIFLKLNNRLELGRTLVSQAKLAAARKDQANGRILLNEARLIFQQLGARLDLQRVQAMYHIRVTY